MTDSDAPSRIELPLGIELPPGLRLISFDIDGTLEVGDPPGEIPLAAVHRAFELGFVVGSCSDRTVSTQKLMWDKHQVPMQFTVLKQQLPLVKAQFQAEYYVHIGDTDVDAWMAKDAGFDFLHVLEDRLWEFLRGHDIHHHEPSGK